jgi:(p)ppGpp synthase/HD superfamily hydrolase
MTAFLTSRFEDALRFASEVHRTQTRKGGGIPYIAHLLAVTALVLENGGDEDTAIAALLHDTVEDQGGLPMLERVRSTFGPRVAAIVMEVSDNEGDPKPPWKVRKQDFIDSIANLSPEARLIALSDKLHNVRSTIDEFRRVGDVVWTRFHGRRDGTLWYYREVLRALHSAPGIHQVTIEPLLQELTRAINELFTLAGEPLPGQ